MAYLSKGLHGEPDITLILVPSLRYEGFAGPSGQWRASQLLPLRCCLLKSRLATISLSHALSELFGLFALII